MAAPELWDDQARAAEILKERGALLQALAEWTQKEGQVEDLEVLLDLATEEEDHKALKDVVSELAKLEETFRDWELKLLLGNEEDQLNAIVTIHAGAGGTSRGGAVEGLTGAAQVRSRGWPVEASTLFQRSPSGSIVLRRAAAHLILRRDDFAVEFVQQLHCGAAGIGKDHIHHAAQKVADAMGSVRNLPGFLRPAFRGAGLR